jgi:regulator of protease activity HflC (stomatin/prohibitin superfamily)
MPGVIVALIILIIVALLIAVSCVKIVPQATACVVERLGGYLATWSVGIHFKAPFIDRVAKRVIERTGGGFPAAAGYHKR